MTPKPHNKREPKPTRPNFEPARDPDLAGKAREELDSDMTGYAHLGYRMARGASL